jgi:hypothetical protein
MSKEIKYTIHFGETKSFKVNEWLYGYFNSVKKDSGEYEKLYKILTGVKK